jgi:hypothetical protein
MRSIPLTQRYMAAYVLGVIQETYMPTPERLNAVGGAQKDAKWLVKI